MSCVPITRVLVFSLALVLDIHCVGLRNTMIHSQMIHSQRGAQALCVYTRICFCIVFISQLAHTCVVVGRVQCQG